jgi:hypothetical protein
MSGTVGQTLCTHCGLCCSGAIFADVELRDEREARLMECLGLEIEEDEGQHLLVQPCRALKRICCEIYIHRPECCRKFECKLLKDLRSGQIGLAEAVEVVRDLVGKLAGQDQELARTIIDNRFLDRRE